MKKNLKLLILISVGLILTACAVNVPQPTLYTLNPGKITTIKAKPTQRTLLVLDTDSVPAFRRKDMAYVLGSYQIAYYAKHSWVAAPAQQLTPIIVTALQESGHYKGVVTAPFIGITNLRLATRLIKLEQIFSGNQSSVLLQLSAHITNATTGKLIASREFQAQIPAPQNNPYGGVIAANQAAKIIVQKLVQFCLQKT